jgi:hypothetical protein
MSRIFGGRQSGVMRSGVNSSRVSGVAEKSFRKKQKTVTNARFSFADSVKSQKNSKRASSKE